MVSASATISGFQFQNDSVNSTQHIALSVQGAVDVTIEDNRFWSTVANGTGTDRGINLDTTASGNVTISDNFFGGAQAQKYGDSNWRSGVWSDGKAAQLTIADNVFEYVRTGLNLDGYDDGKVDVTGNVFQTSGSGISIGSPTTTTYSGITDNTFKDVDTDLNLQNVTGGVTIDLSASNNTAPAFAADTTGVMVLLTGTGADVATGSTGADLINSPAADAANDTFKGGAGNDTIVGSGGTDTSLYATALTSASFAAVADANPFAAGDQAGWTVNAGADGLDNLVGVEIVDGAEAGKILLVGSGGFATIQAAVDAAASGDTIMVAAGTYTEDVTVTDKAIAIIGAASGVNINGQFLVSDAMDTADVMRFENLNINADGKTYGISVRNSATDVPGVNGGTIVLDGVSISNANELGFFYAHPSNGSNPTNPNTVGTIQILDSTFTDNGHLVTGARGQGHVNLFGFNGNLTVDGVTMTGPATNLGDATFRGGSVTTGNDANPDKAISVTGIRTGTPGVGGYVDAGNLVLNDVTITGNYSTDVLAVYTVQSFASVTVSDVSITARGPWGLVNFDSVSGPLDLSGVTGTNSAAGKPIVVLQGLSGDDTLTGSDGNDVLWGRGGTDTIDGGAGIDTALYSDAATAAIDTATGKWKVTSADGVEILTDVEVVSTLGGKGDNLLLVGGGGFASTAEALASGITGTLAFAPPVTTTGDDTLSSTAGNDTLDGGKGIDTADFSLATSPLIIEVGTAKGTALGADTGLDTLISIENIIGGSGNDTITGSSGANVIDGGDGNDTIAAGSGNDTVKGGKGDDTIAGGVGNDTLSGGDGNDSILGEAGNDTINGDAGDDSLSGGLGNDIIDGGADNDMLLGDAGNDTLLGGLGDDTLVGGAGNDILKGGDGIDVLDGGLGNDKLYADADDAVIQGGAGTDELWVEGATGLTINDLVAASIEKVYGSDGGNDVFKGETSKVALYMEGRGGGDELVGGLGADKLYGGDGTDVLKGGAGNDLLEGGADADELWGGLGADTLMGGDGTDLLIGGAGNDKLYGGADADVFVFDATGWGRDTIYDFQDGVDKLEFSGIAGLDDFGDLTIRTSGNSTILTFGKDSITLLNTKGLINGTDIDFT